MTHPLQTKEWGEFRKEWGNEVLETEYGIITTHKIPLTSYKVGIFEGLLIAMVVHGFVHYLVYTKHENMPGKSVVKRYFDNLKKDNSNLQ